MEVGSLFLLRQLQDVTFCLLRLTGTLQEDCITSSRKFSKAFSMKLVGIDTFQIRLRRASFISITTMKLSIAGYRRPDGGFGIRNHVLVLPASGCAYQVAHLAGKDFDDRVVVLPNQQGCGQIGKDLEQISRTLSGLATNPNVAATLIVGLGCEAIEAEGLANDISRSGKPTEYICIQREGGTLKSAEKGTKVLSCFLEETSQTKKVEGSLTDIILGLECGASDATSGLAANPALGVAADLFIQHGGSVLLSETTELIGAEHLLERRIASQEIKERLNLALRAIEQRAMWEGVNLRGTQPSPGNMAGGITTLEEKSLGCLYKAGQAPIQDVIRYGEKVKHKGLSIMDTPGQDIESIIGMLAGGSQVVAFATGSGTPVGSPIAPVLKITANPQTYQTMKDNVDLLLQVIKGRESIEEAGRRVFAELLEVINGKLTKSEVLGHREFALWRIGSSY
jgi:altronate dehydratase large subunit